MPLPRRAAAALVLGALTVVVAILAGLAVIDPFHLRYAGWFSLGLIMLVLVLVTATLAVAVRGVLRWIVLVLGVVAGLGWAFLAWFAIGIAPDYTEVRTVAADGKRLVVLEGGIIAIDPLYSVVVRSGAGPFEQQSLVYQGQEDGPGVDDMRFVDADTVEVQVGTCGYRSEIDTVTLDVSPVHSPLLARAC